MSLSSTNKRETPLTPAESAPASQPKIDIFYSFGTLARSSTGFVISSWLLYFYLPPDGSPLVPAALYGLAIIIGRIASAALTPLIGYLSDNAQSRWGRRLPFMFTAGLPIIILFVLLWHPPLPTSSIWNLLYLGIIFGLFRAALALYQVPYESLLPEIAAAEKQRVRISAWQSGFMLLGMVAGGVAGFTVERFGYSTTALIYAAIALVAFYLPFLVLRERETARIAARDRIDFRRSLSITLKNRPFMLFLVAWAIYMLTTSLVQSSAPFIVTEVCRLNKSDTILFYIPGLLASLASYPLVTRLTNRWGKRTVFAASFLFAAIVFPSIMLIGDWLMVSLKAQCISWAIVQAVSISGMVVLTAAFVAEITDYDHTVTGQRREGMYYATMHVMEQLATGLAALLLPLLLLLGRSQNDPNGPLGVRFAGVVGGLLMLVGFLIFLQYPLRKETGKDHHP